MSIVLDQRPTEATIVHGLATDDERALLAWHDANPAGRAQPPVVNRRYELPWDTFDWRTIEEDTGLPCPETVQRLVIDLLRGES